MLFGDGSPFAFPSLLPCVCSPAPPFVSRTHPAKSRSAPCVRECGIPMQRLRDSCSETGGRYSAIRSAHITDAETYVRAPLRYVGARQSPAQRTAQEPGRPRWAAAPQPHTRPPAVPRVPRSRWPFPHRASRGCSAGGGSSPARASPVGAAALGARRPRPRSAAPGGDQTRRFLARRLADAPQSPSVPPSL